MFVFQPCRIKGDIGQSTDEDSAPLVHCVRLLSASFLLTGKRNGTYRKAATELREVTSGFRGWLGDPLGASWTERREWNRVALGGPLIEGRGVGRAPGSVGLVFCLLGS